MVSTLGLLFGGSALITLAYIAGLAVLAVPAAPGLRVSASPLDSARGR